MVCFFFNGLGGFVGSWGGVEGKVELSLLIMPVRSLHLTKIIGKGRD